MSYLKVDDQLHDHRKTRRALRAGGVAAMGLWVIAGSWCRANHSEGFVPADVLVRWGATDQQAEALVTAGLWHAHHLDGDDGWVFHDWDDHQHTEAYLAERRRRDANRKRHQRATEQAQHGQDTESAESPHGHGAESAGVQPNPTQPQPKKTLRAASGTPTTRGSRLPEPFPISDDMRDWGRANVPGIAAAVEHEKFCDYWRAQPGQRGVKLDWVAVWRNWMRRAYADQGQAPVRTQPQGTQRWTPPEPPAELADDPRAAIEWQRARHAEWLAQGGAA